MTTTEKPDYHDPFIAMTVLAILFLILLIVIFIVWCKKRRQVEVKTISVQPKKRPQPTKAQPVSKPAGLDNTTRGMTAEAHAQLTGNDVSIKFPDSSEMEDMRDGTNVNGNGIKPVNSEDIEARVETDIPATSTAPPTVVITDESEGTQRHEETTSKEDVVKGEGTDEADKVEQTSETAEQIEQTTEPTEPVKQVESDTPAKASIEGGQVNPTFQADDEQS